MILNELRNDERMKKMKEDLKDRTNREYRSTVFTSYFGDPVNAAQLYEGMEWLRKQEREKQEYESGNPEKNLEENPSWGESIRPEDIVFKTLEGVLYLARKNDLAFTVKSRVLVIGEHQSTLNENMPLRSAIYYGRTMERLIDPRAIYRNKRILIPTPEFYVFYNGQASQPLEQTLYLSDSYLEKTDAPMLQLAVKVININLLAGHPLLKKCRPLYEYSWFMWKVQEELGEGKERDGAIKEAMESCVRQGIMVDFIAEHGSEVRNMLFTEFNLEDARAVWEEEARQDGLEKGRKEGTDYLLIELISKKLKKGKSPDKIADELEAEPDKIENICRVAENFGPDYDVETIFKAWREQ